MEEDEDDSSDFQMLERSKNDESFTEFGRVGKAQGLRGRRTLQLSLKSRRSRKTNSGIHRKKRSGGVDVKRAKDQLGFCPSCQVPFAGLIGITPQGHVQECVERIKEASEICPYGISCDSINPEHFRRFSHQQLADSRSIKDASQEKDDSQCSRNGGNSEAITTEHCCKYQNFLGNTARNTFEDENSQSTCSSLSEMTDITEHKMSTSEDDINSVMEPTPEIPGEGNKTVDESSGCTDDVDQWLNDDFNYEDFEPDIVFSSDINSSDTSTSTSSCTSSQKVHANKEISQKITCTTKRKPTCKQPLISNFIRNQKQPTTLKQMDIGVFFGLKPKQNADKVKTITSSAEVSQKDKVHHQERQSGGQAQYRKCPFYKIVDGTTFVVDAFSYGNIPGISAYFLSHFHYDHYTGLKKTFSNPIYCSQITANLVSLKIRVANCFIHPLPLHEPVKIQNIEVTLLEANHCPGAVMFLFKLPNGKVHLHTGDFRASPLMETNSFLCSFQIHTLYLDTTYCDPNYSFPPQSETIAHCVSLVEESVARNSKTLIVVGTYMIGKERIFVAVADALQCKVAVRRDKYNVLQCLESKHLKKIITQNYKDAQVHVLPMSDLTHKKLSLHLKEHSSLYCEILAIKPTGWTFTDSYGGDLANVKPSKRGLVTIYGIPYSEHSSYKELERFVKFIKPSRILPTVNNGSAVKRDEMTKLFREWLPNKNRETTH